MGNYCSDRQEAIKAKAKQKVLSQKSSPVYSRQQEIENFGLQNNSVISMLNTHHRNTTVRSDFPYIESMELVGKLGKGGQAEVFEILIQTSSTTDSSEGQVSKNTKIPIALKRIHLSQQRNNRYSINLANKLMMQNSFPFLMTGLFCCESDLFLYEGMNVANGGDLNSFLEKTTGKGDAFRRLGQNGIRMTVAGIVLGLQHLHQKGLIHCDLKTENVLIGSDGYPIISDFQLTKDEQNLTAQDFEGTLTYMGPEIIEKSSFNKGIDLWALGILIYTLTYNELPYSKEEVLHKDFVEECKLRQNKYKVSKKISSLPLSNLINSLLRVIPESRLGYENFNQIKNHEFFMGFEWSEYQKKQLINPLGKIVERFPLKRIKSH